MTPNSRSRHSLSTDERSILEDSVLPSAKRWMRTYAIGSSMFHHGLDTVLYWSAQEDPDIRERFREYQGHKKRRA